MEKQDAYFTIICTKETSQTFGLLPLRVSSTYVKHYRISKFLGKIEQVPASIPGRATNSQFGACL